jgi:hypothetical protein
MLDSIVEMVVEVAVYVRCLFSGGEECVMSSSTEGFAFVVLAVFVIVFLRYKNVL